MIAIIIWGNDLFEKPGAVELARQAVQDGGVLLAARALSARVVARDVESVSAGAHAVHVDGQA